MKKILGIGHLICVLFCTVVITLQTGCENSIQDNSAVQNIDSYYTVKQFDEIKAYMTYAEVSAVLGGAANEIGMGPHNLTRYTWYRSLTMITADFFGTACVGADGMGLLDANGSSTDLHWQLYN